MGQATSALRGEQPLDGNATVNGLQTGKDSDLEMQAMLCVPSFSSSSPSSGLGVQVVMGADGSATAAYSALTPILCLDASSLKVRPLLKLLELPPSQRLSVLEGKIKDVNGILLHVPADTRVGSLKQLLLPKAYPALAAEQQGSSHSDTCETLHLFAIPDPSSMSREGAAIDVAPPAGAPQVATSGAVLALPESLPLSNLTCKDGLFFLPVLKGGAAADRNPLQLVATAATRHAGSSAVAAADEEMTAATTALTEESSTSPSRRTLVLLYSQESSFGGDGLEVLLIGCVFLLCTLAVTGICWCVDAARKKKNSNKTKPHNSPDSHFHSGYDDGCGGNKVPVYDPNSPGMTYYGPPQTPPQSYTAGYSNGYAGGGYGTPGYGAPLNAPADAYATPSSQPTYNDNSGSPYQQPQGSYLNGPPMQAPQGAPTTATLVPL